MSEANFEEMISKRLEELIFDQNLIVTYKLLSRDLEIHVNKTKQYLENFFLKHYSNKNCELAAYYFLAGSHIVPNSSIKSKTLVLVSYDKLEKIKKTFEEITSCHIYSVNKGALPDKNALYQAEKSFTKNIEIQYKFSAFKCRNVIRTPKLITSNQSLRKMTIQNSKNEEKHIENAKSLNTQVSNDERKIEQVNCLDTIQNNASEKSKRNLQADKTSLESEKSNNNENPESKRHKNIKETNKFSKSSKKGLQNNLMNMFAKQAEKKNEKTTISQQIKKEEPGISCIVNSSIHKSSNSSKSDCKKIETKQNALSCKRKIEHSEILLKSASSSGYKSDDDFQTNKKKRKRIAIFEDSDSESESEEKKDKEQQILYNSEDPLEIPASFESNDEEPIPPTPPVIQAKKKFLKTITKTYQDEEGFFVTKKEKEFVSESDGSDEEDPLKVKAKEYIKNNSDKINFENKKQVSLISFFKHK